MPLTYEFSDDGRIVIITGEYADPAEWRRILTEVSGDRRFRHGCAFLRDQRQGTRPADAATVVAIMEVVAEIWKDLRPCRAAIVSKEGADAPAQVAHAAADARDMPIRAFNSYDSAMEWLRAGLAPASSK